MTIGELLERTGLTRAELAEKAGVKDVKQALARPAPRRWVEACGLDPDEVVDAEESPPGRASEQTPRPPRDARLVEPPKPLEVDFSGLAEYIESAYRLSAEYVVSDPLLAESIQSHAAEAGRAWAKWAESEPRIAALLQRMMVGTPMGEVIAVHVGIGAGYFLARSHANRLAAAERARQEPEPAPEDERLVEPRPAFAGA